MANERASGAYKIIRYSRVPESFTTLATRNHSRNAFTQIERISSGHGLLLPARSLNQITADSGIPNDSTQIRRTLACRLPPRLPQWLFVFPRDSGIGQALHGLADAPRVSTREDRHLRGRACPCPGRPDHLRSERRGPCVEGRYHDP
jgi:hypothetical protein